MGGGKNPHPFWCFLQALTLFDFKKFLKRNSSPHSRLEVIMMGKEPFDMLTVIDEQKYERMRRNHKASWGSNVDDWIETGHGYDDYMRMCWIINVGYLSGYVPLSGGNEGEHDDDKGQWVRRPYRSILGAIPFMLKEGCLCPNREVATFGGYATELGYIKREQLLQETAPMSRLYADLR